MCSFLTTHIGNTNTGLDVSELSNQQAAFEDESILPANHRAGGGLFRKTGGRIQNNNNNYNKVVVNCFNIINLVTFTT